MSSQSPATRLPRAIRVSQRATPASSEVRTSGRSHQTPLFRQPPRSARSSSNNRASPRWGPHLRQETPVASLLPVNLEMPSPHSRSTPPIPPGHKKPAYTPTGVQTRGHLRATNPPPPRPGLFRRAAKETMQAKIRVGSPFRTPPGTLPRSIRESDQVDAGTSSRGIAGSPSPIMEPRNACRFTKFNVQGRNRGIPPIDELSEHRFAPGGQLCAEQRPLRGSTGVPLRLANFRRTATIPSKKGI
jgi:hypothetical protein